MNLTREFKEAVSSNPDYTNIGVFVEKNSNLGVRTNLSRQHLIYVLKGGDTVNNHLKEFIAALLEKHRIIKQFWAFDSTQLKEVLEYLNAENKL